MREYSLDDLTLHRMQENLEKMGQRTQGLKEKIVSLGRRKGPHSLRPEEEQRDSRHIIHWREEGRGIFNCMSSISSVKDPDGLEERLYTS